jgi:hypothetical protein
MVHTNALCLHVSVLTMDSTGMQLLHKLGYIYIMYGMVQIIPNMHLHLTSY